jgi:hypothetical protein
MGPDIHFSSKKQDWERPRALPELHRHFPNDALQAPDRPGVALEI